MPQVEEAVAGALSPSALYSATAPVPARSGLRAEVKVTQTIGVRCEIVTEFAALEAIATEWERLWEADRRGEIFQTFAWARAWWQAYGGECTLCSALVFDGEELIGVLPLVRRGEMLEFLGLPQADYADVICEEHRTAEVLAAALDALLQRIGGDWQELALHHLAGHSRFVRHAGELPERLGRLVEVVAGARYQTLVLRENREEVFKSFLGKNHTKRRQNKLQKAGKLAFRFMETREEAQQYLTDFFRHHVRRRAMIGKDSACAKPEFRNFLRALVEEVEPVSRLRFGAIELNGQPFGWGMGFETNGKFLFYQHTFDLDTWDYSPGEVVLWNLLQYAQKNIAREFDFGKGEEAYKDRFTNYSRQTYSVYVERQGMAGELRGLGRRVEALAQSAAASVKRAAQEHRPLIGAFRSAKNWTSETLAQARQAAKNGGLAKFATGLRRGADTAPKAAREMEVFVAPVLRASHSTGPEFSDVSVAPGRLSDLVDLALEWPDKIASNELMNFRQWLKRGDRVYLVRERGQAVMAAWVTNVQVEFATHGCQMTAGSQAAMLMDACLAMTASKATWFEGILSSLSGESSTRNLELMIRCATDQPALRSELKRQGFLPQRRTIRYAGTE